MHYPIWTRRISQHLQCRPHRHNQLQARFSERLLQQMVEQRRVM
jgi:hypothetical protein